MSRERKEYWIIFSLFVAFIILFIIGLANYPVETIGGLVFVAACLIASAGANQIAKDRARDRND